MIDDMGRDLDEHEGPRFAALCHRLSMGRLPFGGANDQPSPWPYRPCDPGGRTLKIRRKTTRSFKNPGKALAHAYLASFLRGQDGVCDLRQVI